MKLKDSILPRVITFFAISVLFLISLHAQQETSDRKDGNGKVPWNFRLSPNDTSFIEVIVNTAKIPKNYVVDEVSFRVAFYDSNGTALGEGTFYVTDENNPPLTQGRHLRRFRHAYNRASRVAAGVLYYSIREKGTRLGEPRLYFERRTDPQLRLEDN